MKQGAIRILSIVVLGLGPPLSGAAFAASGPSLAFDQPQAAFGTVYQRSVVEQTYPFVNQGTKAVTILAVRPRFEGGTGEAVPSVVPPGGQGEIRVRQPVGDRLGVTGFRIAIDTDDPNAPLLRLSLSGFVESAYEPQTPKLEFGTVLTEQERALDLELASREVERLEVREVLGAPAFVEVNAAGRSGELGEGILLKAKVRKGAPIGIHTGTLVLRTNVPNQPEIAVPFSVTVYGDVVPESNPVSFALIRTGQSYEAAVALRSRSGTPFSVESAVDPEGKVEAEVSSCSGVPAGAADPDQPTEPEAIAAAPCQRLTLRGLALTSGPFGGTLNVRISGQEAPLPIRYAGLVASPTTQIKRLDMSGLPPTEVDAPRLPFDLKPVTPAKPAAAAPVPKTGGGEAPDRPVATLRWQASKEEGVFGYRVLRSTSRLGPFLRINRELVSVPEQESGPHSYVFQDFDVAPGATYYYYLDLVTTSGEVRRFSGVLSKTVSSASDVPADD